MVTRELQSTLFAVGITAMLISPVHAVESPVEPWELLEALRSTLADSPRSATFVQHYRPAGFTSGERESGKVYLSLPSCLRWDYELPYPKTFLLCGDTVSTWNSGESTGRRYRLDSATEPGLDLIRLQVEELRKRYSASSQRLPDGSYEIILTPAAPDADLAEARMTLGPHRRELSGLAYRDREGNTTRFEIDDYQPFAEPSRFAEPPGIEWLDE